MSKLLTREEALELYFNGAVIEVGCGIIGNRELWFTLDQCQANILLNENIQYRVKTVKANQAQVVFNS